MKDCLFCRIVSGEIPAKKVYEDEHTFAFEDINPQAPTHVLIVGADACADRPQKTHSWIERSLE